MTGVCSLSTGGTTAVFCEARGLGSRDVDRSCWMTGWEACLDVSVCWDSPWRSRACDRPWEGWCSRDIGWGTKPLSVDRSLMLEGRPLSRVWFCNSIWLPLFTPVSSLPGRCRMFGTWAMVDGSDTLTSLRFFGVPASSELLGITRLFLIRPLELTSMSSMSSILSAIDINKHGQLSNNFNAINYFCQKCDILCMWHWSDLQYCTDNTSSTNLL